jgi:hypothetical protein
MFAQSRPGPALPGEREWSSNAKFKSSPPVWPQLVSSQLEWCVARVIKGLNRTR